MNPENDIYRDFLVNEREDSLFCFHWYLYIWFLKFELSINLLWNPNIYNSLIFAYFCKSWNKVKYLNNYLRNLDFVSGNKLLANGLAYGLDWTTLYFWLIVEYNE